MFSQGSGGPQTGGQFTTSAINQQGTSLLGNPQIGGTPMGGMPMFDPGAIMNSTAPQSSTATPGVADMVAALKGSAQ